jgi:DNA polymerase (family 10)
MPILNSEIADFFYQYADLLEIEGANAFRVRAYRTAARNISNLPQSVSAMLASGEDLSMLPGVGKDLAGKIEAIIQTGKLPELERIKAKLPAGLLDIMMVAGLGPKRVASLYHTIGITGLQQLEQAARDHRIRDLPGFGEKTEQKILEEVERLKGQTGSAKRFKYAVAEEAVRPLVAYLRRIPGVGKVEVAGSYRRRKETIGDLDIVVTGEDGAAIMERFTRYEDVDRVIASGGTRSTVMLRSFGMQVDVRVVPEESYGSALHYFTGSQAHNVAIRLMGVKRGLKINEYGVFRGDERIAGRTEAEVYRQVGLPYIEPELRENSGEIEAAGEGRLPGLVSLKDIRGDLHAHTKLTDGRASLAEMAAAAKKRGYEYLAITEHSRRVTMAKGLDAEHLAAHIKEIDRLNDKLDGIVLLKSIEVDILEDGGLDLPDRILKQLDLIVCAVHYNLNLGAKEQTARIIKAINNPYFTVLAHPTGRLIGERDAYQVDMEAVLKAARETGTVMEVNGQPERLDLNENYCRMAKEMGIRLAISTDSHSAEELDFMRFGVYQARRGWLEVDDVINTRSLRELKKLMRNG